MVLMISLNFVFLGGWGTEFLDRLPGAQEEVNSWPKTSKSSPKGYHVAFVGASRYVLCGASKLC